MSVTGKILIFLGMLLALGALGFVIYTQHQLSAQQTAIQTEQLAQRQLIDGVVRAQTTWATKEDVAALLASNGVNAAALAAIQADMSSVKASLTTANVVVVNSQAQNTTNQDSTGTGTVNPTPPTQVAGCPNPDPFGYMKAQQQYQLNEQFGTVKVPFGTVGFSAFQTNPWSANITARQYTVDNVIGTDENQRNVVYNQVNIKEGNNTYTLPITSSTTKQVYPSAKFSFWNPRLFLTAGGSADLSHIAGDANFGTTFGIMSYGKFKNNPDVSVLQVGIGYQVVDKSPTLILNPVSVNVGHVIGTTLVNNTYLGPSIQYDTHQNVFAGLNLSIGF
jgi:hypothetical protein